jgi:hypothetical protein
MGEDFIEKLGRDKPGVNEKEGSPAAANTPQAIFPLTFGSESWQGFRFDWRKKKFEPQPFMNGAENRKRKGLRFLAKGAFCCDSAGSSSSRLFSSS